MRGSENLIEIIQLNDDLEKISCFGEEYNFIKTEPYTMTPYSSPLFDGDFDISISSHDITVQENALDIFEENQCTVISSCDSISIKGDNRIVTFRKKSFSLPQEVQNAVKSSNGTLILLK